MYKFGKLAPKKDERTLKFAKYFTGKLPKAPKNFGLEVPVNDWKMLGNDKYGNCVFAGAAHEHILWNNELGRSVTFNEQDVINDYLTFTGGVDSGCVVLDALKFRRNTGLLGADGLRHKIGAFVSIDINNLEEIYSALWIFGAIAIGFEVPSNCFNQFDKGKTWRVIDGVDTDGGHYVPLVRKFNKSKNNFLECVTWGKQQPMTTGFFRKFTDEAFIIFSDEMIKDGKSFDGFNKDQMLNDLYKIR